MHMGMCIHNIYYCNRITCNERVYILASPSHPMITIDEEPQESSDESDDGMLRIYFAA